MCIRRPAKAPEKPKAPEFLRYENLNSFALLDSLMDHYHDGSNSDSLQQIEFNDWVEQMTEYCKIAFNNPNFRFMNKRKKSKGKRMEQGEKGMPEFKSPPMNPKPDIPKSIDGVIRTLHAAKVEFEQGNERLGGQIIDAVLAEMQELKKLLFKPIPPKFPEDRIEKYGL